MRVHLQRRCFYHSLPGDEDFRVSTPARRKVLARSMGFQSAGRMEGGSAGNATSSLAARGRAGGRSVGLASVCHHPAQESGNQPRKGTPHGWIRLPFHKSPPIVSFELSGPSGNSRQSVSSLSTVTLHSVQSINRTPSRPFGQTTRKMGMVQIRVTVLGGRGSCRACFPSSAGASPSQDCYPK